MSDASLCSIRFADGLSGEVPSGITVLEAARMLDVEVDSFCGGNCSCGTCRVEVVGNRKALGKAQPAEHMVLGPGQVSRGFRLACQARILADVEIRIADWC